MKITPAHVELWQSKQRQPAWMPASKKQARPGLIDECINGQMEKPRARGIWTEQLLTYCKSPVENGNRLELIHTLYLFSANRDRAISRRTATARKWLAKIAPSSYELRMCQEASGGHKSQWVE